VSFTVKKLLHINLNRKQLVSSVMCAGGGGGVRLGCSN